MSQRLISADDRVADVLARDECLVDVFESVSPAFGRLRDPRLRKVMARLVTVGQAARVASVDPGELLERLNAAVGAPATESEENVEVDMETQDNTVDEAGQEAGHETEAGTGTDTLGRRPAAIAELPDELVLELDVRPDLREGREPFSRIMAAKRDVPDGGALMLRAIFEPAPLYAVLAKQGWANWTEQRGPEDWVVWFYRADAESDPPGAADDPGTGELAGEPGAASGADDGVVVLDVRGMEPPEPMVRTLAALETLPRGDTLVQINVREPRFLLPQLKERGFVYEVREQAEDLVRVFIRHADRDPEE